MTPVKPKVIIFSGYGLNCEDETKFAFEHAGALAEIVHINDVIARPSLLRSYQIAVFPGGFSYGDDTGSGKAYGRRVAHHLSAEIEKFLERDTLMLGVCNGFQILTSAGVLTGALVVNDNKIFTCRWTDLIVTGESPWLTGIERLSLPIAHGEGKYYDTNQNLKKLSSRGEIALRYVAGEISKHFSLAPNPNGSLMDIAGITARKGRVFGLMPHPERAISFTQLPHWTWIKTQHLRSNTQPPSVGPGLQIFQNGIRYFE